MVIQKEKLTFNVDFDGTCVTHEYPRVGKDIGAVPVLKKLVEQGHKLILFTMRSNKDGKLEDAINWFKEKGIPLYGIQTNPTQGSWTSSPKSYAQLMIDDSALGCPLTQDMEREYGSDSYNNPDMEPVGRPYVDWFKVEKMLINKGIIK